MDDYFRELYAKDYLADIARQTYPRYRLNANNKADTWIENAINTSESAKDVADISRRNNSNPWLLENRPYANADIAADQYVNERLADELKNYGWFNHYFPDTEPDTTPNKTRLLEAYVNNMYKNLKK